MGIANALPADPSVLHGVNIVTYLMARARQLGFNTFRCVLKHLRCVHAAWSGLMQLQHMGRLHWFDRLDLAKSQSVQCCALHVCVLPPALNTLRYGSRYGAQA